MPTGKVKWFNDKKGYGFIAQDDGGSDLFFHSSAVEGGALRDSDPVRYEIGEGRKGPCATKVTLIEEQS